MYKSHACEVGIYPKRKELRWPRTRVRHHATWSLFFFFLPCRKLTWLEKWRNPVLVVVSPQMAKILLLPKISCRWLTSFTVQALCAHIVANHHLCLVSEGQEEREKKKMVQIPCTAPPYRTSTLDKNHVLKRAITRPRVIWFLVVSTST